MDIIRTTRTYATRFNAITALRKALMTIGGIASLGTCRWLIAVDEDGRYAPVVSIGDRSDLCILAHHGVTIIN
jgi:hypothetical protein